MIMYFAGNGRHSENDECLYDHEDWGVLLSYKALTKDTPEKEDRAKRFRLLREAKRREE